jgi:hypothetical protein
MKGTKYRRMYFRLYPSTHRTEGTGYGLLPTPQASDYIRENQKITDPAKMEKPTDLPRIIQMLLTTPREAASRGNASRDRGKGNLEDAVAKLLPTPRACEAIERRNLKTVVDKVENGGDVTLTTMARYDKEKGTSLLPTPTMNCYKGGAVRADPKRQDDTLAHHFASRPGTTSQLNPLFVAEMMGYPVNWTVSPFQNGEMNQSKDTEMP